MRRYKEPLISSSFFLLAGWVALTLKFCMLDGCINFFLGGEGLLLGYLIVSSLNKWIEDLALVFQGSEEHRPPICG